jgi:hypothetical protein
LLYCNAKEKISLFVPIETTTHIPDCILQYRSVAVLEHTCTKDHDTASKPCNSNTHAQLSIYTFLPNTQILNVHSKLMTVSTDTNYK